MRMIDADQMAVDESEAYMSAQVQITDMQDADGTKEIFTVPTENERKDKHENYT